MHSFNFTEPTIVTSNDLTKRSYITFYFNNKRIREYNGNSINKRINPNRVDSVKERNQLLSKLKFELHKALEGNDYPAKPVDLLLAKHTVTSDSKAKYQTTHQIMFDVVKSKIRSDLSRTYKRDLKSVYRSFRDYLTIEELQGPIKGITISRIEKYLASFGSSGTYYMNKRRNLNVIISAAGKLADMHLKIVKETQRRKVKATLHEKYEQDQLKPIFNYLQLNYPNLFLCCLLTYGSWLRPHEEIRLLTKDNFENDFNEVHLSGNENKGGKVRVVYIPDYIKVELVSRIATLGRSVNIFSLSNKPFNESYFNTQWSRAYVKMFSLGLVFENQTIYSFRHTAAVGLYKKTKDVYLLQQLLGHSSIVVTLKYLRNLGALSTAELKEHAPSL